MKATTYFFIALTSLAQLSITEACQKSKKGESCGSTAGCCGALFCCAPVGKSEGICYGHDGTCQAMGEVELGARRHLEESLNQIRGSGGIPATKTKDNFSFEHQKTHCSHVQYSLAVHVKDHISLVALPLDSDGKDCHVLLFDDDSNSIGQNGKQVTVYHKEGERTKTLSETDDLFVMDVFELSYLADAFDQADHLGTENSHYDIVNSNCATFALSMLQHLNYEVGPDLINYVIGKLASTEHIPDHLRQSDNLSALGDDLDPKDSLGLMKRLVERYVEAHA